MDMDTLRKAIDDLELRKKELLREIKTINLEVAVKKAQYANLKNNQAPIYRLPNELLTGIFIECQRTQRPLKKANIPPFQVMMSHISHRWREIVITTPLLWNTINFRILPLSHVQKRILEQLEAYLTRSGSCFLDITLDFDIVDDISSYFTLLQEESSRWRRLSIVTRSAHLAEVRSLLQNVDAPILEHLSLSLGKATEPALSPRIQYPNILPSIITHCFSPLRFVRLAGLALGNLHPPMTTITTLHLDGWTRHFMRHEQLKTILEASTSLVNLSFNQLCIHHPRDPSQILEPINLPHLKSLRLVGPSSPVSYPLLVIKMPQLLSLSLHNIEGFDSDTLPSVKNLILDSCTLRGPDITHLFDYLPSVTSIRLDESVADLFNILLPDPNQPTHWPHLHTIWLRELQSVDVPHFCHMILSIQDSHKDLSRVNLDRRSRTVLRAKHRLDFLERVLKLEVGNWDGEEPWPVGLGYLDPHDLWE